MGKRPGPKKATETGTVKFEVSPAGYRYLQLLVDRTGIAKTPDGIAAHLFTVELQRAMQNRSLYETDPSLWLERPEKAPQGQ